MDEHDLLARPRPRATPERPMLGLTLLLVEDSRFASEALRLLCLRSGARIRRADSLLAARRHLKVYRPSVIVVDLGLPDGSGLELIEELNTATPRIGGILGLSGDQGGDALARRAGADGFLAKPIQTLHSFQSAVLGALPPGSGPWPPLDVSLRSPAPDRLAYRDDLLRARDLLRTLTDGSDEVPMRNARLSYLAQFLGGVARSADDDDMAEAADALEMLLETVPEENPASDRMANLLQERLEAQSGMV